MSTLGATERAIVAILERMIDGLPPGSRASCCVWNQPAITVESPKDREDDPDPGPGGTTDQLWDSILGLFEGQGFLARGADGGMVVATLVAPGVALVVRTRNASAVGVARVRLKRATEEIAKHVVKG